MIKKTRALHVLIFLTFIFTLFNGYLICDVKPEIEKLEKGLLPPILIKGETPWTLAERMKFYSVPGVSIAVIKDFKIDWTKGFGIMDIVTKEPVSETTLFQAASVSKPVSTMAVLKEVQDGKLKLDQNVNDFLVTWKLPDNEFTAQKKVTIQNLLTHTGGVTVSGFRGYSVGEPLPTLVQVLNGQKPANSAAIVVDMQPGLKPRYSGGGYCILQQALIDTEKLPFPDIMDKLVFKPLGMNHSTYRQPLPDELQTKAATGHRANGLRLEGKWHIYPEMAAAGLWTTSEDMAKYVIEIQRTLQNKPGNVFSQKTAQLMLTPYLSPYSGYLFLDFKGKSVYFYHGGDNEGFKAYFIGHKEKGFGAVVMTNGDKGEELYSEIIRGIANIYQWDDYLPPVYDIIKLDPAKLKPLAGKYALDSDHALNITFEDNRLYAQITFTDKAEIFPISDTKFIRKDDSVLYEFVEDSNTKQPVRIVAERNGMKRDYERKGNDYVVPLELLLERQLEPALEGYRKLRAQNPSDPMLQGIRFLYLAENLFRAGYLNEGIGILHLTAEFYPEFIKSMYSTLNNEMRMFLNEPSIPDVYKTQLKEGYNSMLRKLGLKEIE